MARSRLIAGNWKMNGSRESARALATAIAGVPARSGVMVVVCPPFALLDVVAAALRGSAVALGAQDCHTAAQGAFTGDVAAPLLAECGCGYVIVGHSERRQYHGETDAAVAAKALAAQAAGLIPILCVGETLAERDAGRAETVVAAQIAGSLAGALDPARLVLAYEPVWAIGTGRVPAPADIAAIHQTARHSLTTRFAAAGDDVPVLYGGSVKGGNAAELLAIAGVDGALVGGAALDAGEFAAIIAAA